MAELVTFLCDEQLLQGGDNTRTAQCSVPVSPSQSKSRASPRDLLDFLGHRDASAEDAAQNGHLIHTVNNFARGIFANMRVIALST